MLPWAFEPGMGFERYVDYALSVPMYFVKRGDQYIDVAGQSFRDLMEGRLSALPGERATISDWANHISTIFPEVRLKRYLEMRGADGGPWRRLPALPAYWAGILYDDDALDAAWDLVKPWTARERQKLRDDVPKLGFAATIAGRDVLQLAKATLALAQGGLARRRRLDANGYDESRYLQPIEEYVARGITPAQELLDKFHGAWGGSVEPVFREYAY
jgi:glutamate--cysteine ligase